MKYLLSMLAVSTLVGTSASNLKPVFTSNVVNHGFKSNQINQKDLIITNENDTNPFVKKINEKTNIKSLEVDLNGTIWAIIGTQIFKSADNFKSFEQVTKGFPSGTYTSSVNSLTIDKSGTIWVTTTNDQGLYKSTDNGIKFEQVKIKGFPNSKIDKLAINQNGDIYGSNQNQIYISKNLGENFEYFYSFQVLNQIRSISVTQNGDIYVGTNKGLYKSKNNNNFEQIINGIPSDFSILSVAIAPKGTIYVGGESGLYKSSNGTDFKVINNIIFKNYISPLIIFTNQILFTTGDGLYKIDLLDNLLKINNPDYFGNKYNGFVYKNEQIIELKPDYLKSSLLDGITIDVSSKQKINIGIKHNLILTLNNKDNCNQYLDLFDGDSTTGQITYNFWIKNEISKDEFNYSTITHDTDLLTGLVANISTANTYNSPIIQTRQKDGSGVISLDIKITSEMINFENSYYEQGTINDTTNDFTATGSKQKITRNLSIKIDGIYHLHLVDVVGNTYDSYLELGESNWKLKGTFDDKTFNDLARTLNVTVNIISTDDKKIANGWLNNYKNLADSTFNSTVLSKGKGFIITIDNDLKGDYKSFLDPITYVDSKTQYAINQIKLDKVVTDIATKKLQDGLGDLPQNLNVDTKNVVNKSTLDSYTSWINSYNDFVNNHKDQWINEKAIIAGHGFASREQIDKIKDYINSLDFKEYLKPVEWNAANSLTTSNDYKQYIELDKLQTDTINWVNANMKDINIAYQQAIKKAESGLNLHGYSIDQILNGKSKPQTKNEIANFADGKSYHDWLQSESNIKFHGWELLLGFSIGIPLILLSVVAGIFIRRRTNPKYNPFRWERKKEKQHSKLSKSINSNKNKKRKNNDK